MLPLGIIGILTLGADVLLTPSGLEIEGTWVSI